MIDRCGSCLYWDSRLRKHYDLSRDSKSFYQDAYNSHGGLSRYHFTRLYVQPNWVEMFKLRHPESSTPISLEILKAFTRQSIRTLEQSYSTYTSPTYYNSKNPVYLWHINWHPETRETSGMVVEWLDVEGVSHSAPSIKSASRSLNVSMKTVRYNANVVNPVWIQSSTYGEVTINIPSLPEVPTAYTGYKKPQTLLTQSKNNFMPSNVTNILTGEVTYHKSINAAIKASGWTSDRQGFLRKHVLSSVPFNGNKVSFINPIDHNRTESGMAHNKSKKNSLRQKEKASKESKSTNVLSKSQIK